MRISVRKFPAAILRRRFIALAVLAPAAILFVGCPGIEPVYFVVAEAGDPVHGDSYIIGLTNPDDIEHARALIADPIAAGAPILVCRLERGSGSPPNRNVTGGGQAWSWHVAEFEGFTDSTIEILDGWPTYVEENLDAWIANTNSRIGFWSYTVVQEISADELE